MIDGKFDYVIKQSIPESVVHKDDCYFFGTQDKFPGETFTKFSKEDRLGREKVEGFVRGISDKF